MKEQILDMPRMSSSEEMSFKTCRLAHHFQYDLGWQRKVTNQKLSTGSWVHHCLEAVYTGGDWEEALTEYEAIRWDELVTGYGSDLMVPAEERLLYVNAKGLVATMVEGYIEWAAEEGLDDGYEVVEVERKHYIDVGAATVLPMKFDLLLRHTKTGRYLLVDFKTRASFSKDAFTPYQLAEQTLNYAMGVLAVYGEVPSVQYRELRKIKPSGKSKPPYFRSINLEVSKAEVVARVEEYKKIAADRMDDDRAIYSNPSACCGSWKNDWQGPCLLVHQGYTPEEALNMSDKYAPRDAYERYKDDGETTEES